MRVASAHINIRKQVMRILFRSSETQKHLRNVALILNSNFMTSALHIITYFAESSGLMYLTMSRCFADSDKDV